MKTLFFSSIPRLRALGLAVGLGGLSAGVKADVVYVTSMIQGCTATSACGAVQTDGTYTETGITLGVTTIKGHAPGRPTTPGASRAYLASALLTATDAGVDITPALAIAGGVYQIDYNWNSSAGNSSTDVVLSVTCSGGTLSFTSTELFRRSNGIDTQWKFMGYVTNDPGVTTPVISFRYQSGTVSAAAPGNRLLFDCWRFTAAEPCLTVGVPGVTGPLGTNSAGVVVTTVSNTATEIRIYQNAGTGPTNIGSITTSSPPATVSVPVTGVLVRGAQVSATQIVGGQESCIQAAGTVVGGGSNPEVRVALSVREDINLVGPVGSDGGGSSTVIYWIGASNSLGGSPDLGLLLQPGTNWQTITFNRGVDPFNPVDPVFRWNGTGDASLDGDYGVLEGLSFAPAGDSGPYSIYIDDFENGTNGLVQGWEAATAGQAGYMFLQPSFSGTTAGNILGTPNSSVVVTNTAYSGGKCVKVDWQFNSAVSNLWLRLTAATGAVGMPNPEIDLNEPVSFKVLLLPPGAVPPPPPPQLVVPGPLSITIIGSDAVIYWSGTFFLQSANNVLGPYDDVPGVTTGPYTNTLSGTTSGETYFRLRNPVP